MTEQNEVQPPVPEPQEAAMPPRQQPPQPAEEAPVDASTVRLVIVTPFTDRVVVHLGSGDDQTQYTVEQGGTDVPAEAADEIIEAATDAGVHVEKQES